MSNSVDEMKSEEVKPSNIKKDDTCPELKWCIGIVFVVMIGIGTSELIWDILYQLSV